VFIYVNLLKSMIKIMFYFIFYKFLMKKYDKNNIYFDFLIFYSIN